jgi:hypothetical protein
VFIHSSASNGSVASLKMVAWCPWNPWNYYTDLLHVHPGSTHGGCCLQYCARQPLYSATCSPCCVDFQGTVRKTASRSTVEEEVVVDHSSHF